MSWACLELASVWLPDARLDKRLIGIVEKLSAAPEASVTEALGTRAEIEGACRFWKNNRVRPEKILAPHARQTARRASEYPVVLVAQDTSEIDITDHPSTKGVGYLGSPYCRGLFLHSLLAIAPTGVPLGVLRQFTWARPLEELGKRAKRRRKKIENKESQRWLDGLAATGDSLPKHPHVVLVGDRESDIFELFSSPRPANVDLLVRVSREKRRVEDPEKYLDGALGATPVGGHVQIELPRRNNRPPRTAKLAVRWLSLAVRAPRNGPKRPPIRLWFVLAEELDPPPGQKPIRWFLATTLPIDGLEDALRYLQWYAYRWTIERFHFVLKSGYRIEDLQLDSVERMERAIATFSIVAWRVLWLTHQARETPNAPCTVILDDFEWQSLYATTHHTRDIPHQPPTLREAVRMIAKLGGFLGRKCDGEPGPKTIWRGLRRLHDISQTWLLLQPRVRYPPR